MSFRVASRGLIGLPVGATSCVSFSLVPAESTSSLYGGALSRDGGADDGDAVADGDAASQKIAFILKAKVAAALATTTPEAALDAADALCDGEFLRATGRQALFVAWLGTGNHPVLDRFGTSRGPWYLPSGERVARSFSDLAMKGPEVPINTTAWGTRLAPDAVWTGTAANGSWAGEDCQEWKSANSYDYGRSGSPRPDAGGEWSAFGRSPCDALRGLYCFER